MKTMRNVFLLYSVLVVSLCMSCSQDGKKTISEGEKKEQEFAKRKRASKLMLPYIELVGDRYVLTLTEKDAKALGISSELYYEALSDVDKANITVRELQNDPTVVLELGTPQESIDDSSEEEAMPELQVMPKSLINRQIRS